jgi:hypothetical protein
MTESPRDMLERLKLIASGDRDCDLSDNDTEALKWIISRYEYFTNRFGSATPASSEALGNTGRSAAP